MDRRMLFIFNPKAGKGGIKTKLAQILDIYIQAGFRVEVYVTQGPLDAARIVKERGQEFDIVAASGGDGTLNEVITGAMALEHRPQIGYIPSGTTNDFGFTHHIPKDMIRAAHNVAEGSPCAVDIGSLNDRYFAYVAAFGVFTDVPYKTKRELKAILGYPAYLLEVTKSLGDIKAQHVALEVDGNMYEGDVLVGMVSNADQIAGIRGLGGRHAATDDGKFEVLLVENPQNLMQLTDIVNGILNNGHKSKFLKHFSGSDIRFVLETTSEWVIDGEFGGEFKEAMITDHARAVDIIKPVRQPARALAGQDQG